MPLEDRNEAFPHCNATNSSGSYEQRLRCRARPALRSRARPRQVEDWNTPPAGTEQAQQGYKDGLEAAKLDKAAKRKIDAKSSHLYKNPPVKGAEKDDYRMSFEKGYEAQVQHNNN